MNPTPAPDALYPPPEPDVSGWLDVGDGHRIYFEQCGQPAGLPVLLLHGGPGSGCSPQHRRLLDPAQCRLTLFDQRGCGRSQPRGALPANTSAHLVADIELLRRQLGIERWLVVGGSWGAGLALAYAAAHPAACLGLVLRAVFLGRRSDLDWFFQHAAQLLPDAWDALARPAPPAERGDLLHWLGAGLHDASEPVALQRAQAWRDWENSMTARQITSRAAPAPGTPEAAALLDLYRVQHHYLAHGCFWGELGLLERARALAGMPTALLHGRLDWICRPQAAWELQQALPASRLQWVENCGHSPFEPAMARAFGQAVAHYALHGDFSNWGAPFPETTTP